MPLDLSTLWGASIRRLSRTLGQASGSLNRGVDEVRIALERGLYLTAVARASGLSATPATTVGVGHEGSLVGVVPNARCDPVVECDVRGW